jgi:hypothetical protein
MVVGPQVQCRELDTFKILGFFQKFFGNFMYFWGIFWKLFGIFFGVFFGRNFLGEILWEEFFVYILNSAKLFEYRRNWFVCQDFGFCQDFVSMEKEGRRARLSILRSARGKLIALKNCHDIFYWILTIPCWGKNHLMIKILYKKRLRTFLLDWFRISF